MTQGLNQSCHCGGLLVGAFRLGGREFESRDQVLFTKALDGF